MIPATIDDLFLTVRADNCLRRAKITSVFKLAAKTRSELLTIRGMGVTSVRDVEKSLMGCGLRLGMQDVEIAAIRCSEDGATMSDPDTADAEGGVNNGEQEFDSFMKCLELIGMHGIRDASDLMDVTSEELLKIPDVDEEVVEIIKKGLSRWGLRVGARAHEVSCGHATTFAEELLSVVHQIVPGSKKSAVSCFVSYHGVSGSASMTLQEIAD